jgi:hypothetical protein
MAFSLSLAKMPKATIDQQVQRAARRWRARRRTQLCRVPRTRSLRCSICSTSALMSA